MLIKIKPVLFIVLSVYLAIVCSLFCIKDRVEQVSRQLDLLKMQIEKESVNLRILKAELTFLVSPDSLANIAALREDLRSIKVTQIVPNPLSEFSDQFSDNPNGVYRASFGVGF
ncbi:hypothetical protein Sarmat_00013 [Rickettsiales endosymbiont of Paramecium tredecaurelia]|uniref:hypothetical protein n=1 Tax=Candidatus Sarmatiella mevalonica TaxID=2770581 RepID=UPI0019230B4D|nr:hypothetical protein [Candidatus Sarmatiella mevalonica]MBL3284177.1 hypothetical protein [Candidatus Sarmatiella mevalonica]